STLSALRRPPVPGGRLQRARGPLGPRARAFPESLRALVERQIDRLQPVEERRRRQPRVPGHRGRPRALRPTGDPRPRALGPEPRARPADRRRARAALWESATWVDPRPPRRDSLHLP